ncbi:hypothetical protein AWL63_18400 [Sphingomonas panacis]|uniref:JmjC domain-containing protein n=1 Tax=Sphingomonas panacis TaxID=1560345 RepID=A0A1B3ZDV1_9SPHN|nr:cupin domain-containing protein [Sphingomonas panacis]AOH85613.1 hypothetical protein AWL63_18400 [Sphingomonas panacis]
MINFSMSRDEFRTLHFEQKPRFLRKCFDPAPYGWSLIDRALDLQDPTRELLKVLYNGRTEPSAYVEEFIDVGLRRRRILKDRLYNMIASGATIVLNRIELVSTPVRDICLEIGRFVGAQTSANAYASLGEEAATNVHWDTHDVFVVQVAGRKHWRLYEPTHPLPISSQVSNERKDEVPATPVFDDVVEAGDILYVPRGWWHRVVPVAGYDTIHFTVAVHTPLILDYLVWACASTLPDLVELRHSLLGDTHDAARVDEAAQVIAKALRDPAMLDAFYTRSQQRERVVTPFNIDALVKQADRPLAAQTRVTLNARQANAESPVIHVNGNPIHLMGDHERIVRQLADTTSIDIESLQARISDIPAEALQTLLRDLARADLIRLEAVVEPLREQLPADL